MISLKAVVFDLELVKRYKKGQLSEIIEIGACQVDLQSKQITRLFQQYILPKSGYITKSTREFINMTKEDMKRAVPFHTGIEQFCQWLGHDYFLCSWGKDDRHHLINECVRNELSLDWLINYTDIQLQLGKLLSENPKNQLGLLNALEIAGIDPTGKAHRGIDDAYNTALLLIKYMDHITFEHNKVSEQEIAAHRKPKKRGHQHHKKQKKTDHISMKLPNEE